MPNFTDVTESILLGLTSHQELRALFFVVFLAVFMITLRGNIALIALISISPSFRVPCPFSSVICLLWMRGSLPKSLRRCGKLTIRDKNHFLCVVSGAVLLLQSPWPRGSIYLGGDGLWLLHGHLQPSALRGQNVQDRLCSPHLCAMHLRILLAWSALRGHMACTSVEPLKSTTSIVLRLLLSWGGVHIKEYTMTAIAGIGFTYPLSVVLISTPS